MLKDIQITEGEDGKTAVSFEVDLKLLQEIYTMSGWEEAAIIIGRDLLGAIREVEK